MNLDEIKFDERGLVPAIVQDARNRAVLTLAYMNLESLRRTLETGETWFWSRSRRQLWHKGETSGNTQRVTSIAIDCDDDALRIFVLPAGPACHTGEDSCFHRTIFTSSSPVEPPSNEALGEVLEGLYAVLQSRQKEMPEGSYTSYLFAQGLDKILKKVGEESTETIIAAKNEDRGALVSEACDLLYHLLVLLVERQIPLSALGTELTRRRTAN